MRNASICGRKSVPFVENDIEATCAVCQRLATDGTLEKLRFQRNSDKFPGANQTGTPMFTEMQRAFAAHPVVTTNPMKAALESGYSESYAKNHAAALRKQLAPLIMEYQEMAKRASAISVAKVQSELAAMGFANIVDYFNVDERSGRITPKQFGELTRDQAAAIQEVKMVDYVDEETGETHFVIGHIKLADKRANLVELGKTLGMFNKIVVEDKREQTLLMQDIPTDALEEAESLLLAAASQAKERRRNKNAIPGQFEEITDQSGESNGPEAVKE